MTWSQQIEGPEVDVIRDWAKTEEGWELYQQSIPMIRAGRPVEQLALLLAALMSFQRLVVDYPDTRMEPTYWSYVADMFALLIGEPFPDGGKVLGMMVFALIRHLRQTLEKFADLVTFLETTLNREHPPLHVFDGLSDPYVSMLAAGHSHLAAIKVVNAKLASMGLHCFCFPSRDLSNGALQIEASPR